MGERRRYRKPTDADRDRDPKALGDLLPTLVKGRGWREHMALGELRTRWADVVGPQVAARSRPISLQRGTLTIAAEGGAWATELTLLAAELATKADAFLGAEGRVKKVTVAGGTGPRRGRR